MDGSFSRYANALALAATLALALLPSLGRLGAWNPGLKRDAHAAHHAAALVSEHTRGSPQDQATGPDCEYCLLLASTVLSGARTEARVLGTAIHVTAPAGVQSRTAATASGLGARGPPHAA